jgi:hypothetical protein
MAWGEATKEWSVELGRKAQAVQNARESAEIIGRTSQFALDMEALAANADALQIDGRPATEEERERYFNDQSEQLRQQALDWTKGSREAKSELANSISRHHLGHQIQFMRDQEQRALADIRDKAEFSYQTAVQTDDLALFEESTNRLVASGAITAAKWDQLRAEFPVNAKIEEMRQAADIAPEDAATTLRSMLTQENVTAEQQSRIRSALTIAEANLRLRTSIVEAAQERTKTQFVGLLTNLGNPTQPQLTPQAINESNLTAVEKEHYLGLLKTWSHDLFEDNPEVVAAMMERQRTGKLGRGDATANVGYGLSPKTAQDMDDPDSFYKDPAFAQVDTFLKGVLRYSPMNQWSEYPEGIFGYEEAMKAIREAIRRSDPPVRGEKLYELGVRTGVPIVAEFYARMLGERPTDESIQKQYDRLKKLGGGAPRPELFEKREKTQAELDAEALGGAFK